jgi:hypothetical protein
LSGSAPRPASVQKDSMICDAIRFAAAISFVPVLRNTTRRTPLMAGGMKRTCQSLRPDGDDADKIPALDSRTIQFMLPNPLPI